MSPLTIKYLEFYFSFSLEQIIASPARTTDITTAPIGITFCTQKTSKSHKHDEMHVQ